LTAEGSGVDYVDDPAPTTGAELHSAIRQSEQGVISAAANPVTGMEVGAVLADNDLTSPDGLATKQFDAQTLGVRIAAVPGRGRAFLVCH
jgi:hypothetical protein